MYRIIILSFLSVLLMSCQNDRIVEVISRNSEFSLNTEFGFIHISNANQEDIQDALKRFCMQYNGIDDKYVLPTLNIHPNNVYSITFDEQIEFNLFCYLVNFIEYPIGIKHSPRVRGWIPDDQILTRNNFVSSVKHLFVYVPQNDKEFNFVNVVDENDVEYRFDFEPSDQFTIADPTEKYRSFESISKVIKTKTSIKFQ